jgi:TPR repeat protein
MSAVGVKFTIVQLAAVLACWAVSVIPAGALSEVNLRHSGQSGSLKPSEEQANRPIGDKWAVIIGIDTFKDSSIPHLQFPSKDAADFADFLIHKGNFALDHVLLLTNERATRDNIRDAIGGNWLPRRVDKDDLVLIYASTHGSPKELDVAGENFLVAYDSDPKNLYVTGIRFSDLAPEIKERTGCDRVVLLLDACNSGAASVGGKGLVRTANFDVASVTGAGQIVISSSASNQRSFESKRYKNGVFTKQLMDALELNQQKTTLNQAFNRLKEQVENEVRFDRQLDQTPVMRSRWSGGELILLAVPTKPRHVAIEGEAVSSASAEDTYKRARALYDQKKFDEARPLALMAANTGSAQAQNLCGLFLYHGRGCPVDYGGALCWFQKAAEQGNAAAQNHVGVAYQLGQGVTQSFEKAAEWYQKAAELGDGNAQTNLAKLYELGHGVPKNLGKAAEWYQKAAAQGEVDAQAALGEFYARGNGLPQNFENAAQWYQKAADQGNAYAQTELGKLYADGHGVPQNDAKAVEWYRKAVAQNKLGTSFFYLAYMSECGRGVVQDYGEAFRLYSKSADLGNIDAVANIAHLYQDGLGVAQDYVKAAQLYQQAADKGCDYAIYRLAGLYCDGHGVPKDMAKVRDLLTRAAADGYADAQVSLNKLNALGGAAN